MAFLTNLLGVHHGYVQRHHVSVCWSSRPRDSNQLFNAYRKGLQLFVLYDRNGKRHGYLYAGSSYAASNRAAHIIGAGASVEYAGDY